MVETAVIKVAVITVETTKIMDSITVGTENREPLMLWQYATRRN